MNGTEAKTIWPSRLRTSDASPGPPPTVCAPIAPATSTISTIPDHSSGESVRRRAGLAARQRAVRTTISQATSAIAIAVLTASEIVPTVVSDETWIDDGGHSAQWASKPNIRNGTGPRIAIAYAAATSRRCRLTVPSG